MSMIGFGMFEIMFFLVFALVLTVFAIGLVRGLSQWNKNNQSPRLTVEATVVSKRADVSHHHHAGGPDHMGHTHSSTSYYVTFQVESGDRMELHVPGYEYGLMIEGDFGELTFQGRRFLSFARKAPAMDES